MRLYALLRHYGLRWKTGLPPIKWRIIIDALLLTALMFSAYALVEYISRNAALSDRVVISERQKMKAEAALATCLNGGSLATDGGMVMCSKAHWVDIKQNLWGKS